MNYSYVGRILVRSYKTIHVRLKELGDTAWKKHDSHIPRSGAGRKNHEETGNDLDEAYLVIFTKDDISVDSMVEKRAGHSWSKMTWSNAYQHNWTAMSHV